jgi:hypothetical protein
MLKLSQFQRYKQIEYLYNTFMKAIYWQKQNNQSTLDLYGLAYSNLSWN